MTRTKVSRYGVLLLATILTSGCITTTTRNGRQIPNEPSTFSKQVGKFKNSVIGLVQAVTPDDQADPIRWEWAAGIPQAVVKGESVPVHVPEDVVAHFAPGAINPGLRLASATPAVPMAISVVNDTRIRTLADLDQSLQEALDTADGKAPVVEFVGGMAGSVPIPVQVAPNNLVALAHACVPERTPVRVIEDGNLWVLVKDDAVRCKIMIRKERYSQLLHVVVSLKVCWGPPRKLPVGLTASCDGQALSCQSVAGVLDQLYADERDKDDSDAAVVSYNEISELDEFLIPVNYRALEAKLADDQRLASLRPHPAFAVVGGYAYPGPPVLGDARALSGFMLQPRVFSADESEHVGWVVFDSSTVPDGEFYETTIDLGSGPQTIRFKVPNVGA